MKLKNSLVLGLSLLSNLSFAASGSAEDKIADIMTWVVIIVLPPVLLYLFWIAHIYPEKVAEKRNHPQLESIKMLCLLSLFVGGLLWPFALVWASYNYEDKNKKDFEKHSEGSVKPQEQEDI